MSSHVFIAGAQRAGTTYLHQLLSEHPEIEMNQPWWPEPKFFLRSDYRGQLADFLQRTYSRSDAKIRGEKSVCYMEHPEAAERIAQCFPNAKIVFSLRDPIDRAISNYFYSVENKLESIALDEALSNEHLQNRDYDRSRITGCPPYNYLKRGRYADYLDTYVKLFGRAQIKVCIFEELVGNYAAIAELYDFLGVDSSFIPPSATERLNSFTPDETVPLTPTTVDFLIRYYSDSNERLIRVFGLNLSKWRSVTESAPVATLQS